MAENYEEVTVTLTNDKVQFTDMQQALRLAEESICPVWQMVKNNVVIQAGFAIN